MRSIRLFSTACFIFFCIIFQVQAATFYVAPDGSDGASGFDLHPWQTLQHAADSVSAGDTVIIRNGIYLGFRASSGGTQGNPITFRADTAASVVINSTGPNNRKGSIIEIEECDWWVLQGLEVTQAPARAGIDIRVADHVTVTECYCHHNQKWGIFTAFADYFTAESNICSNSIEEHGIYHSNSGDNAVIRYNTCHHNNACGIQINADPSMGGDGISSNNIVTHNILFANGNAGGAAINLASVRDSLVADNLIYNNHAGGIAAWDDDQGHEWGSSNNRYYNNTIHMPSDGRWAVNLANGSTDCEIINNILIHENNARGGLEIDSYSLSGLISDYNIMVNISVDENTIPLSQWQSGYSHDVHSFGATAVDTFLSPDNDYHLQADSSARDGGVTVQEITTDITGATRPIDTAYDIGAYEFSTGTDNNNNTGTITEEENTDQQPEPTLFLNDSDESISISSTGAVSVAIGLNSAGFTGQNADWWIVQVSPSGIFYFDLNYMTMKEGLNPSYQGPLFQFSSFPVMTFSSLEPGTHDFYFAIDMHMNGTLDIDSFFYKTVRVNVTSNTGPGHISYRMGDEVFLLKAEEGAVPENISTALNALSPLPPGGIDTSLNLSPDGNWFILETERFDEECKGWGCLAVVKSDLSSGAAVHAGGGVIHVEGFSAIASEGNLIVYPSMDGTHTVDLWAVKRSSNDGEWSTPVELTCDSTFQWNNWPAISKDGTRIVFNCTDEPYSNNASICEIDINGNGFRRILGPADSPDGYPDFGELHSPDFAPDGSIIFESSWDGEEIWKLPSGATVPVKITDSFNNDNSPCVLPDGSIASLWLNRAGSSGFHELKVMSPDGTIYTMLVTDTDIFDIGLGCGE